MYKSPAVGDGTILGTDEGTDDGAEDGLDGCREASTDGFEDVAVEGDGVSLSLGWALQDGAVEGVVVGEELVDGLADLAVLAVFILRRFEPFPPSHSSLGYSLRELDLYKRRKH